MKPENILVNDRNIVKIADFGLAKEIRSAPPFTDYVSTRWYRAPELLLKAEVYNTKVDIFALGCIMVEMYLLAPLFAGENEMDQLHKIICVLGTPPQEWTFGHKQAKRLNIKFKECEKVNLHHIIPNASGHSINLLDKMLQYDPVKRISASDALTHPFFGETLKSAYNGHNSPTIRPAGVFKANQSEVFDRPSFKASSKIVNDVTNLGAFDADDSFGIDNSHIHKAPHAKGALSHRPNILDELEPPPRQFHHHAGSATMPKKNMAKNIDDLDDDIDFFFSSSPPKNLKGSSSNQIQNELSPYAPHRMAESPAFKPIEKPHIEVSLYENYTKTKKDHGTFGDFDKLLEKEYKQSKEKSAPVNSFATMPRKPAGNPQQQEKAKAFDEDDDWDNLYAAKSPPNRGFLF
jgi:serine/threonine protein kinase